MHLRETENDELLVWTVLLHSIYLCTSNLGMWRLVFHDHQCLQATRTMIYIYCCFSGKSLPSLESLFKITTHILWPQDRIVRRSSSNGQLKNSKSLYQFQKWSSLSRTHLSQNGGKFLRVRVRVVRPTVNCAITVKGGFAITACSSSSDNFSLFLSVLYK